MDLPESYVVRVYRREPNAVEGVVVTVETGEAAPFHTSIELWSVLCRYPLPRPLPIDPMEENGT
jgi:hypothetical protein